MRKYYIEVYDSARDKIVMQSKWFNTEEKALAFANAITYTSSSICIDLMASEWDILEDTYIDIIKVKTIEDTNWLEDSQREIRI